MEQDDLEAEYSLRVKKYKLPSFSQLNEEFEIYKMGKDKKCVLRAVRKAMVEKIVNSMSFFEMLLNGVNSPRVYLPYLRTIDSEDRATIDRLYNLFADLSLISVGLEVEYSEKGEAEAIKHFFDTWIKVKSDFKKIVDHIRKPNAISPKRERNYFG